MTLSKTAAAAMLLLALSISGCGRKGPLYMQQAPVKPASAPIEQKTPVKSDLPIQSQPVPTQTEYQKQP
jgi:predicted small lipoprotein YifL